MDAAAKHGRRSYLGRCRQRHHRQSGQRRFHAGLQRINRPVYRYHYTDPNPLAAQSYYRINITGANTHRYSNLVLLGTAGIGFEIRTLVNPFTDHITMDLTTPGDGTVVISLTDMYGRVVRREKAP